MSEVRRQTTNNIRITVAPFYWGIKVWWFACVRSGMAIVIIETGRISSIVMIDWQFLPQWLIVIFAINYAYKCSVVLMATDLDWSNLCKENIACAGPWYSIVQIIEIIIEMRIWKQTKQKLQPWKMSLTKQIPCSRCLTSWLFLFSGITEQSSILGKSVWSSVYSIGLSTQFSLWRWYGMVYPAGANHSFS